MTPDQLADVLRQYATPRYSIEPFVVAIVNPANGVRTALPLEKACEMAADYVERAPTDALVFRELVARMRKAGLGSLFKNLMGFDLPPP